MATSFIRNLQIFSIFQEIRSENDEDTENNWIWEVGRNMIKTRSTFDIFVGIKQNTI